MNNKNYKQYHDLQYIALLDDVLNNGKTKGDRTGTGTRSVFGREMVFDLSDGSIPLLTNKKMHLPSIFHELLWYISGDSNVKYLQDNGVRIWNEWAADNGDLGPVYGRLWRSWPVPGELYINYEVDPPKAEQKMEYVDQLADVIDRIKNNPDCRRLIVNSWKPDALPDTSKSFDENVKNGKQALPPCHYTFQFYVAEDTLSLKLTQRSCDVFLGVPFNIAQYSILLHMVAQITGKKVGEFIWSGGDCHVYNNHVEQCEEFISRDPFASPYLDLNKEITDIDAFKYEDIANVVEYHHHSAIKASVAI
jgi:thymidylate synthase